MVGVITVINTMTISVTERRREIGIKRAIVATQGMIMRELVWETGFMGLVGELAGLALAGLVIYFSHEASQSTSTVLFHLTRRIAVLGVTFSTVLGTVAGVFPVWSVARLEPVESLSQG